MKKRKPKSKLTIKGLVSRQFRDDLRDEELRRREKLSVPQPIYSRRKHEAAVLTVAATLEAWSTSPFQHEAACRNGLRSAFCLEGYGWHRSHAEAESLVSDALKKNGASRPSWLEGQHEYLTPRENCNACAKPLEDYQIARGARFCCVECARAVVERRNFERIWHEDEAGRAAKRMVRREKGEPRTCEACSRPYFPALNNPGQRFCSTECFQPRLHLDTRECLHCKRSYKPRHEKQVYCGQVCYSAAGPTTSKECVCAYCSKVFTTTSNRGAVYCSASHKTMARGILTGKWKPREFSPLVFDSWYREQKPVPPSCLTPMVFDRVFRLAA